MDAVITRFYNKAKVITFVSIFTHSQVDKMGDQYSWRSNVLVPVFVLPEAFFAHAVFTTHTNLECAVTLFNCYLCCSGRVRSASEADIFVIF
jgi:hypothetical protein